MAIPYLKILKEAFKISWGKRYLWWFGFLISLSGFVSFGQRFGNQGSGPVNIFWEQKFSDFASQNMRWIFIGAIILLIIFIALIIIRIIFRGALIDSISRELRGEKSDFKSGFRMGRKYFGRIFLITLASGLFVISSVIVIALPVIFLFFNRNYLIGIFMGILAAVILIPIFILAVYLKLYGYLYAVFGNLHFWSAIEKAYSLFQKNIFSSLIMGLLFMPIGLFLAVVIMMAIIPIAIIFLMIGIVLFLILGKLGAIIAIVLAVICVLPILFIVRSIYEVFSQAVWIIFFQEIASPKMEELVAELEAEAKPISKPMPIIDSKIVE